jgi:hypothetical protein
MGCKRSSQIELSKEDTKIRSSNYCKNKGEGGG